MQSPASEHRLSRHLIKIPRWISLQWWRKLRSVENHTFLYLDICFANYYCLTLQAQQRIYFVINLDNCHGRLGIGGRFRYHDFKSHMTEGCLHEQECKKLITHLHELWVLKFHSDTTQNHLLYTSYTLIWFHLDVQHPGHILKNSVMQIKLF